MIFCRGGYFRGETPLLHNASPDSLAPILLDRNRAADPGFRCEHRAPRDHSHIFGVRESLDSKLVNTPVGIFRISGLLALFFANYPVDILGPAVPSRFETHGLKKAVASSWYYFKSGFFGPKCFNITIGSLFEGLVITIPSFAFFSVTKYSSYVSWPYLIKVGVSISKASRLPYP